MVSKMTAKMIDSFQETQDVYNNEKSVKPREAISIIKYRGPATQCMLTCPIGASTLLEVE